MQKHEESRKGILKQIEHKHVNIITRSVMMDPVATLHCNVNSKADCGSYLGKKENDFNIHPE